MEIAEKKANLKELLKLSGISYQEVSDFTGASKYDISRIMNDELESKILNGVCKLIMERNKKVQKKMAEIE
jgi:transcriptional regulator with XRE-family HTH domain